jgi:hypothetical protein
VLKRARIDRFWSANKSLTAKRAAYRLPIQGVDMDRTISTIGYEGSTIEGFVTALRHASIDVLSRCLYRPHSQGRKAR